MESSDTCGNDYCLIATPDVVTVGGGGGGSDHVTLGSGSMLAAAGKIFDDSGSFPGLAATGSCDTILSTIMSECRMRKQ